VAELTGRSNGREDWDCEGDERPHRLVAMGPDQRPPVKAGAFRAPRFAARGLDRMSPARQGLAKKVRLVGKRTASLPKA